MLSLQYVLRLLLTSICLIFVQIAVGEGHEIQYRATLVLPEEMQHALDQYDPNFVIWEIDDFLPMAVRCYRFTTVQSMSIVLGDFNRDQNQDVVLNGHNSKNDLILCLLSHEDNYRVIEILKSSLSQPISTREDLAHRIWVYLLHIPKQIIKSSYGIKELKLDGDAFVIDYFGKASILHYFVDGKFCQYSSGH